MNTYLSIQVYEHSQSRQQKLEESNMSRESKLRGNLSSPFSFLHVVTVWDPIWLK